MLRDSVAPVGGMSWLQTPTKDCNCRLGEEDHGGKGKSQVLTGKIMGFNWNVEGFDRKSKTIRLWADQCLPPAAGQPLKQ